MRRLATRTEAHNTEDCWQCGLFWLVLFVGGIVSVGVVVREVGRWWAALAGFLAGCASAPADVIRVNTDGNAHPYSHYAKYDMRVLKPGEAGNCSAIAFTKLNALVRAGYSPVIKTCRLASGEEHLYLMVDEWALDNRYDMPVRESKVGCE